MISTILVSCDCFRSYQGVVYDAESGEPIEGVQIYYNTNKDKLEGITSVSGTYSGTIIGGFMNSCAKPHYFLFSKDGYRDTLAVDSGEVRMIRANK